MFAKGFRDVTTVWKQLGDKHHAPLVAACLDFTQLTDD